jgi:hypothetical protein
MSGSGPKTVLMDPKRPVRVFPEEGISLDAPDSSGWCQQRKIALDAIAAWARAISVPICVRASNPPIRFDGDMIDGYQDKMPVDQRHDVAGAKRHSQLEYDANTDSAAPDYAALLPDIAIK